MKKHNWFSIDGHIRIDNPVTANKLLSILEESDMQFYGSIVISDTKDEDYEEIPLEFCTEQ